MGGFGFPFFGRGRCFDGFPFFGGCGFDGCGRCGDEKKIKVITAVRAVSAKGEGCFDGKFL